MVKVVKLTNAHTLPPYQRRINAVSTRAQFRHLSGGIQKFAHKQVIAGDDPFLFGTRLVFLLFRGRQRLPRGDGALKPLALRGLPGRSRIARYYQTPNHQIRAVDVAAV